MDVKKDQIASLVADGINGLHQLLTSFTDGGDSAGSTAVELSLVRFKLWAGSLGAHRASGSRSLQYRLRDASSIRTLVVSLLEDLNRLVLREALSLVRNGCIQRAEREDNQDSETEELTAYFDDDEEDDTEMEEAEDEHVLFEKPRLVEIHRPRMDPKQAHDLMGEIKGTVKKDDSSDFTHSVLGSVKRNTRMNRRRESQGGFSDEGEDEHVVFKKPRLIEPHRPRTGVDPQQANNPMGEIRGTVKRYNSSDSEGKQDAIIGPSHPSLETQLPITPSDNTPKIQMSAENGPPLPPPPPPPMPGQIPGVGRPPPPLPPPPMPALNDLDIELKQVLSHISGVIDCLLRLSVTISNPAPHDRFKSRAGGQAGYYEPWDIQHVRAKHTKINEKLAQRLGRALTQRRKYFKYREDHHCRLKQGLYDEDDGASKGQATTLASSVPLHLKDTGHTSLQLDLGINDDDRSELSATSYAPSTVDQSELRIPPIPKEYVEGPFLCPFCFLFITVETRHEWKKHVFRDLRPYVCLAEACVAADQDFQRRKDWSRHMSQEHWRQWACPFGCALDPPSSSNLRQHLVDVHMTAVTAKSIESIITQSSKPDLQQSHGACPLCNEVEIKSHHQYQSHVGHHLEQLALFALPSHCHDSEGEEEGKVPDRVHDTEEDDELSTQDEDEPVGVATSYWSPAQVSEFPDLLERFGPDWLSISRHLKDKTEAMVINYFTRNLTENPQWKKIADESSFEATTYETQDMAGPDAVVPRNSPLLVPKKVTFRPSISPPPDIPLVQVSPPPSPGSRKTKRRLQVRPSQGDAVLIGIMDNGRHPDINTMAGQEALPSDSEEASSSSDTDSSLDESDSIADTDGIETNGVDGGPARGSRLGKDGAQPSSPADLQTLAGGALAALGLGYHKSPSEDGQTSARSSSEERGTQGPGGKQ